MLQEINDPSSVDCLFNVAERKFQYLDYDDSLPFARKCIKALASIGNEDAIEKLQKLSQSSIMEIAEYAKRELQKLA